MADNPIYMALDTTDLAGGVALVKEVAPYIGGIKLGLEFFLSHGHGGYDRIANLGLPIFLDLKLHDIPNTVKGGLRAVLDREPTYITIHAQGGPAMVAAAREAAEAAATPLKRTEIIAVTVLTSLDDKDLQAMGVMGTSAAQVARLGIMARDAGADGLVCSPMEVPILRDRLGAEPTLIVPGIRPEGAAAGDQKRVLTPKEALVAGASVLVIGRPITKADDPAAAAKTIKDSLA